MSDTSAIKIVGLDEKRPPIIRKEPYIELFFKLSQKAPTDWCEDFNNLAKKVTPPAKINTKDGCLFIETYVRDIAHIAAHLENIKKHVSNCNTQYIKQREARELAAQAGSNSLQTQGGRQGKLNDIINGLNFD